MQWFRDTRRTAGRCQIENAQNSGRFVHGPAHSVGAPGFARLNASCSTNTVNDRAPASLFGEGNRSHVLCCFGKTDAGYAGFAAVRFLRLQDRFRVALSSAKRFCHWICIKKYGRTFHLPTSPGVGSDDKIIQDLTHLRNAEDIVFTEKMDGENTTIFAGGCHARSPDSGYHASRDWMKAYAAGVSPGLSDDERIVGEYLFAQHSVAYDNLPSYFLGFAWIVNDEVQGWDETLRRFEELGVQPVPVLQRGQFDDVAIESVLGLLDLKTQEGFVVRTVAPFFESDMVTHVAKYVRAGHVQSDVHWTKAEIVKNGLRRNN